MTVNQMIREAVAFTGLDCYANQYPDTDRAYLTFNMDVVPRAFSDDAADYVVYLIQLHLICPLTFNSVSMRKSIKKALETAGFTYPDEVDASDERVQHIVFETEIEEFVE